MNVLVFGGMGKTAKPIIDLLDKDNHSITIFDIASEDLLARNEKHRVICGDIADREAVNSAMRGMDAAIHLAVNISGIHNDELTFKTNVFGTYNILCGALANKIPKVLIASSAPVHTINHANRNVDYVCFAGEDFAYDLTKNLQEVIAGHFSLSYAMNCLVLRLGHIVDGTTQTTLSGGPLSELFYCKGGWVCRYDVAEAFLKALKADFTGYHMINIIGSYQAGDLFDLSAAKGLIGFECRQKFFGY